MLILRPHGLVRVAWLVLTVVLLLPFQNCTEGFNSANSSSMGSNRIPFSYNDNPIPEQLKAIEILRTYCNACHVEQNLGNVTNVLDVDHLIRSNLIVVGQPDSSPLFQSVNNNRMPPSGPLTEQDKSDLRVWILALGNVQDPNVPPTDLSFQFKAAVQPLPYRIRLGKIHHVLGSTTSPALTTLNEQRRFLGDYDYSQSVLPKVSWEATDMKAWMEATGPVCAELRARYPWPSGVAAFTSRALGRSPSSLDQQIINEISARSFTDGEKFEIYCLMTLTSKEFTAK